jgi:hypothetical protein
VTLIDSPFDPEFLQNAKLTIETYVRELQAQVQVRLLSPTADDRDKSRFHWRGIASLFCFAAFSYGQPDPPDLKTL